MIRPLFFASSDLQLPDELREPLIWHLAHIREGYGLATGGAGAVADPTKPASPGGDSLPAANEDDSILNVYSTTLNA